MHHLLKFEWDAIAGVLAAGHRHRAALLHVIETEVLSMDQKNRNE